MTKGEFALKKYASLQLTRACSAVFRLSKEVDRKQTLEVVQNYLTGNIGGAEAIDYFTDMANKNSSTYTINAINECIKIIKEEES